MANPTTNFGWVMPTSTSLVTNLPADFNTFGQGVDTSLQYLLGGTTGQVLSKTSNTNMAFTWVTPTDQTPLTTKGDLFAFSTVDARLPVGANETRLVADSTQTLGLKYVADTTNYAINAKGDLLAGTAADTLTALSVGTNGQTLVADSSTSTGLKWASSGLTLINTTSITNGVSSMSLNNVFSSSYKNYRVIINWLEGSVSTATVSLRLRASGTDNSGATAYQPRGWKNTGGTLAGFGTAGSSIPLNVLTGARPITVMDVLLPQTTDQTNFVIHSFEGLNNDAWGFGATHNVGAAYDGFTVFPSSGTFTGGTIYVYGYGV